MILWLMLTVNPVCINFKIILAQAKFFPQTIQIVDRFAITIEPYLLYEPLIYRLFYGV